MAKKPKIEKPGEQLTEQAVKREMVEGSQFVSLYVNDTQIQITPWDIRFIFGLIMELPTIETPTVSIKTIGEVRMSPQHAKRVATILLQQLHVYEQNIGLIPESATPAEIKTSAPSSTEQPQPS